MYWPPARGIIAASSPYVTAAITVISPLITHARSSRPGDPTSRPISAETMKMPEPIIEPMTIVVASYRRRPLMSSGSDLLTVEPASVEVAISDHCFNLRSPLFRQDLDRLRFGLEHRR